MAQYQATTKSASAPDVEEGMYDIVLASVEAKVVKGGKFQKNEAGDNKLEWLFRLLDDEGAVIRDDNEESPNFGKPVLVGKLTGTGFNVVSTTVPHEIKVLQALLTKEEYQAFLDGEGTPDDELDVSEGGLLGRKAQGEVYVKEGGWPGLGNIIPARKARKAKPAAADSE